MSPDPIRPDVKELIERLKFKTKVTSEVKKAVPVGTTPATTVRTGSQRRPREAEVETRAAERLNKKTAKLVRGDAFKDKGNAAFKAKKFEDAMLYYSAAVNVYETHPIYLANLAAAQLRLGEYEHAEDCADRALLLDPTMIKARYRRGLARKGQDLLASAILDFETIVKQDPTCLDAVEELAITRRLLTTGDGVETGNSDQLDVLPLPGDRPESEAGSDSPDANHIGNGIPCRPYNRNGCPRGTTCPNKHARDMNCVRDDLGRNVCYNFILDNCEYGPHRCYYAHSLEYLPKGDFWDKPDHLAIMKEAVAAGRVSTADRGFVRRHVGDGESRSEKAQRKASPWGFTNAEIKDLAQQGVKPEDEDAWTVLDALYGRGGPTPDSA